MDETLVHWAKSVELRICGDAEALAAAAAAEVTARAREAVARCDRFTIALAGGSTPTHLYELLAGRLAGSRSLPWRKVHVFWGDERVVPPGSPESNFGTASRTLLSRVPIPEGNVHRIRAEAHSPSVAAALYEDELRGFFKTSTGRFPSLDLVLLGLGEDGHTASLFPGNEALREEERLAVAPLVPQVGGYRITLTLPVLNGARAVAFLVSGDRKAEILARVLEGGADSASLPACLVRPRDGTLLWLADRAAASRLLTASRTAEFGSEPALQAPRAGPPASSTRHRGQERAKSGSAPSRRRDGPNRDRT